MARNLSFLGHKSLIMTSSEFGGEGRREEAEQPADGRMGPEGTGKWQEKYLIHWTNRRIIEPVARRCGRVAGAGVAAT